MNIIITYPYRQHKERDSRRIKNLLSEIKVHGSMIIIINVIAYTDKTLYRFNINAE